MLEERLKTIAKEIECSQPDKTMSGQSLAARAVPSTQSLIDKNEIETFKEDINKLEHAIEEHGMKVKRNRHTLLLESERMLKAIVKSTKSATREEAREKEEHKFTANTQKYMLD